VALAAGVVLLGFAAVRRRFSKAAPRT
jgi:hypothetical protein